jgi:hypothetical protein
MHILCCLLLRRRPRCLLRVSSSIDVSDSKPDPTEFDDIIFLELDPVTVRVPVPTDSSSLAAAMTPMIVLDNVP